MTKKKFANTINRYLPFSLAPFERNGFFMETDSGDEPIDRVGMTLGLSRLSVEKAIREKCDALIVHNCPEILSPGYYYPDLSSLAVRHRLEIFRLHLPLDFAAGGLIDRLCSILGFQGQPMKLRYQGHIISGGVYFCLCQETLTSLVKRLKIISPSTIRIAGAEKRIFRRLAVTTGDGCKPEFLDQLRPDVFICGLLNQESERIARDLGITLIEATSYATENEPLKLVYRQLRKLLYPTKVKFIDGGDSLRGYMEP